MYNIERQIPLNDYLCGMLPERALNMRSQIPLSDYHRVALLEGILCILVVSFFIYLFRIFDVF